MQKLFLLVLLSSLSVLACKSDNKLDDTLLVGKWQGTEWTVEGKEPRNASIVEFDFKDKDHYVATYGDEKEIGTYYLAANKLYTTENGKAKKAVVLSKLTRDSIVMEMNRVGTLETLVLVKK